MKFVKHIAIMLILAFVVFSCKKQDCFKSAGSVEKEVRHLNEFDTIYINDYFQVYLKTDSVNKIEIETGKNLIKNIKTDICNNALTVKDLNACEFMKGYKSKKLTICANDINRIIITDGVELKSVDTLTFDRLFVKYLSDIGSCDLTVQCNQISIDVWYAAGKYTIRGKTNYLSLSMNSMSSAYAYHTEAENVYAHNNSLGDIHLSAKQSLNAVITGEGNIYYKGNPSKITLTDSLGTGKLIKVNQ